MTQPSSERLARELDKAGLPALARNARNDLYHDYASSEPLPSMLLAQHLQEAGAVDLLRRHYAGDFDATLEESNAWAESEDGQAAFAELTKEMRKKPPFE